LIARCDRKREAANHDEEVSEGSMTEQPVPNQIVHKWYPRPVFFVADIERSIHFYVDMLGFHKKWHEAEGTGTVCQVDRSDCEIILSQHPTRRDKARLFIELTPDGLAELRSELAERSVPHKQSWWGYDVIQVDDPDGNELLFPYE
jgi:catechol 2,3-dioxygenase-like lactoylglutathione lyase family enzyme